MATFYVNWVQFSDPTHGPTNCIRKTIKTESFSTSGSNAQSDVAPLGANGAIVYSDAAHNVSFISGNSNPTAAASDNSMRLEANKEAIFCDVISGNKIAAITV